MPGDTWLVLYAIAPIREGDELLTSNGREYWLAILHTLHPDLQREAILEGQLSEVEIFTGLQADRDVEGPSITRNSVRLTPILEQLLPHLAKSLLHDTRTVLEVNGLTGIRYTKLDTLLSVLLHLDRLRPSEQDSNVVQNGSRSWTLPPRLIDLGQQWISKKQVYAPFDNR